MVMHELEHLEFLFIFEKYVCFKQISYFCQSRWLTLKFMRTIARCADTHVRGQACVWPQGEKSHFSITLQCLQ